MATLIARNGTTITVPDDVSSDYVEQGYLDPNAPAETETPKRARGKKDDSKE